MSKGIIIRDVLIKDGNRILNWDFKADSSVRDILQEHGFEWEPGSVKVCGTSVPEEQLHLMLMGYLTFGPRIIITMTPKKKEPKKKEEVTAE